MNCDSRILQSLPLLGDMLQCMLVYSRWRCLITLKACSATTQREDAAAAAAAAEAKSLQSCLTLCDLIDGSPPGSPVPGILQARTLEWVAISFFNA